LLLATDRALLDGFRAGRQEALRMVYLHYRPLVAQILRGGFSFKSGEEWLRFRGLRSDFEIEQAVNETMARAFLPAARLAYDGLRPYANYLAAIARNHVLRELRRPDLVVPVGDDAALDEASLAAGPAPVEPTLEEREVERLLARFLEDSSPEERSLFEARFRDEQPQEDAARGLGMSRIRLRRIEYKLKRRLLAYLKKNGYLTDVNRSILGAGLRSVLP
jgi:RNA polymerase sigma-70 factor (ECF subfamily)